MEKRIKLDVSPYNITMDGKEIPFLVRDSLSVLLFNPALGLNHTKVRRNDRIARIIEECKDNSVLLSKDDFAILKDAVQKYNNFERSSIELLDRIDNAEEVEVDIKEK